MTHPIVPEEQAFLMSDRYARAMEPLQKGSFLDLHNGNSDGSNLLARESAVTSALHKFASI